MTTVRMRLRSPGGTDRDGNLFVTAEALAWQDIAYRPVGSCDHQETACRQCLEVWELDWEIDLDDLGDLDSLAAWAEADLDVDDDQADACDDEEVGEEHVHD